MPLNEAKWIFFDRRETVCESVLKDLVTFSVLGLFLYVSRFSAFWSFFMGLLAVLYVVGITKKVIKTRQRRFRSTAELKNWAAGLPDDEGEDQ